MAQQTNLRIGDSVLWRGAFGTHAPQPARVTGITITDGPREKYGRSAPNAPWALVRCNRVVVDLDNGYWAYGEQISPSEETQHQQ